MTASSNSSVPQQIFIIGMNGSGTTMLLDHLSNHSQIFGFPAETKSLPYFLKHESDYGDLRRPANLTRLWHQMKKSIGDRASPSVTVLRHVSS